MSFQNKTKEKGKVKGVINCLNTFQQREKLCKMKDETGKITNKTGQCDYYAMRIQTS